MDKVKRKGLDFSVFVIEVNYLVFKILIVSKNVLMEIKVFDVVVFYIFIE